ncbi:MAG: hypothetical protein WDM92_07205 [Caulobacteraceae bacterium]
MYFLLNDAVLTLGVEALTPPMTARRSSALTLDGVQRLGREMYAEEPRLQHRALERARRLAMLIVTKSPELNAALFLAPQRGCRPEQVAVRLVSLDMTLLAALHQAQQTGGLTPEVAGARVWDRIAA